MDFTRLVNVFVMYMYISFILYDTLHILLGKASAFHETFMGFYENSFFNIMEIKYG